MLSFWSPLSPPNYTAANCSYRALVRFLPFFSLTFSIVCPSLEGLTSVRPSLSCEMWHREKAVLGQGLAWGEQLFPRLRVLCQS